MEFVQFYYTESGNQNISVTIKGGLVKVHVMNYASSALSVMEVE